MNYSETNYEKVARYLDGENVSLDAGELQLLGEVNSDIQATARAMDATVDSEVINRVLRRHRKSAWRTAAGVVAAAAVVVFAVGAWILTLESPQTQTAAIPTVASTNEVVETLATVQSIMDAQQELDIMTVLVQNDIYAEKNTTATNNATVEDIWDMNAWAKDFAG